MSAATGADRLEVAPAAALVGELALPGDKSISHRALLLGAVADGATEISGFGPNADTLATLAAVESLGARVERLDEAGTRLRVHGCGLRGLKAPDGAIDVRNAGTLMRLLPGLLVGQTGSFTLDGDESIRRRPVDRVAMPLRLMGAVLGDSDGRPPLHIDGGGELQPIGYELPVASAQVKSCVLLAGLYAATGPTTVIEPVPTRDHTERLLRAAGARVAKGPRTVSVWPAERLHLGSVDVPGDISSAAPFLVAATLLAESRLFVRGMSTNPTRTGLLTVLEHMGARINLFNRRTTSGGEPIADVEVHPAELVATEVGPEIVPSLIDELPLLALAAAMARGAHGGAGRRRVARQGVQPPRDGRRAAARDRRARARDGGRLGDPGRAGPAGGRPCRRPWRSPHRHARRGRGPGLARRRARRRRLGDRRLVSPASPHELERLAVRPW